MLQIEAEIAEARHIQDKIRDAAFNGEVVFPWSTPADGDSSFNLLSGWWGFLTYRPFHSYGL